jgi:hypothetical protein
LWPYTPYPITPAAISAAVQQQQEQQQRQQNRTAAACHEPVIPAGLLYVLQVLPQHP